MTTIGIRGFLRFTERMQAFANTIEVGSLKTNQAEREFRFCNSHFVTVIRAAFRAV
jgi:hypothetical protein